MAYRFVSGPPSINALRDRAKAHAIDVPEHDLLPDAVRRELIDPSFEIFTDGEVVTVPPDQRHTARQSFTDRYPNGTYGRMVYELYQRANADSDPELTDEVNKLARMCGATVLATMDVLPPNNSFVRYSDNNVTVDGRANGGLQLQTDPSKYVLDIGPGLNGRFLVENFFNTLGSNQSPKPIVAMTNGPFIGSFLYNYATKLADDIKLDPQQVLGSYIVIREDGMDEATQEMINAQRSHGAETEIADVIQMTGVHQAGERNIVNTLGRMASLLTSGGVLIITAPIDKIDEQTTPSFVYEEEITKIGLDRIYERKVITGSEQTGVFVASKVAVFQK